MQLTAGITKANTGLEGISWNILGQTYVPKSINEQSFSWHATFPPGTFVPPHIHPTQAEFIYLLDGRFDLVLDGKEFDANTGLDGISWNILGQTYVPKSLNEQSFSWHATFPPGTFVPPHIHPTQDEFIYMLDGRLDLVLDGKEFVGTTGDLIRLPMNQPHGIFNKSDQTVKCFFWVSPTRRLYDLFWAIHSMKDQNPPDVVALSAKHEVMFLPPPPGA